MTTGRVIRHIQRQPGVERTFSKAKTIISVSERQEVDRGSGSFKLRETPDVAGQLVLQRSGAVRGVY